MYEGLGYSIGKEKMKMSSSKLVEWMKTMQCGYCHWLGYIEDKCWDLHSCRICGLKSHSEKACWNRDYDNESTKNCMHVYYGWIDGSYMQKVT